MKISFGITISVSLAIVLIIIPEVFSIKCWDCRSDADPKCSDPFDNTTFAITDCKTVDPLSYLPDVRATMCRKIRQKVHGVWKYIRSCAYLGEPGIKGDERFCLMRTGTYNIFMEYCTCNSKDGCNTSSYTKVSSVLMWSSVLSFILMKLLRYIFFDFYDFTFKKFESLISDLRYLYTIEEDGCHLLLSTAEVP